MANEEKKPVAPQTKGAAVKRTDKKPGFFKRVAKWFREMKSELKKSRLAHPQAVRQEHAGRAGRYGRRRSRALGL